MRQQPKQARSRKTRETLMSALDTLLKEKDFDLISVTDIAKTAGVSTGLLYAHFKNKSDFLEALLEAYKARIMVRLEETEAQDVMAEYRAAGSLRNALRIIAEYAYAQLRDDAHIINALTQHLRTRSATDQAEWQDLRIRAAHTIISVIDVYADEVSRPDIALTSRMLVYFFNSIFSEALRTHQLGQTSMDGASKETFTNEIADMAYGYLTVTLD